MRDRQFESCLRHFLAVMIIFFLFNVSGPPLSFKVPVDTSNIRHPLYGHNTYTQQPLSLLDLCLHFYFIQTASCSSTIYWRDDLFQHWFNLAVALFSKINWPYIRWVYFWTLSCSIDLLGYSYVNGTVLTSVAIFKYCKISWNQVTRVLQCFSLKNLNVIENSVSVSLAIIKMLHCHMSLSGHHIGQGSIKYFQHQTKFCWLALFQKRPKSQRGERLGPWMMQGAQTPNVHHDHWWDVIKLRNK